jgi:hypothetical protein
VLYRKKENKNKMSEELLVLKEYVESLGLNGRELTDEDMDTLRNELREAGEYGLANWVANLDSPKELLEYISED